MAETPISPTEEQQALEKENQTGSQSSRIVEGKGKVRIYNLTNYQWSPENLSFLLLGPKFVPVTECDMVQLRIDVLNFSRKLLLKAHFHDQVYSDNSLIIGLGKYQKYWVRQKKSCIGQLYSTFRNLKWEKNKIRSCAIWF